jgi:hypothetical protein
MKLLYLILIIPIFAYSADSMLLESNRIHSVGNLVRGVLSPRSTSRIKQLDSDAVDSPELGLDDYEAVARTMIEVQKSMTEKYEVGDSLTFSAYILKTFADIGDYEITQKEILSLVDVFEKLTDLKTPVEVIKILENIEKLSFRKKGLYVSVIFHTIHPTGYVMEIYSEDNAPENENLEIEHFKIHDKSEIKFHVIDDHRSRESFIDFLEDSFKIPLLPSKWFSSLNQVHPDVEGQAQRYLHENREAKALKLVMKGFELRVATSTLFNTIDFEIQEAFTTPGLTKNEIPLPSFHLWMQQNLLKVRASVTD